MNEIELHQSAGGKMKTFRSFRIDEAKAKVKKMTVSQHADEWLNSEHRPYSDEFGSEAAWNKARNYTDELHHLSDEEKDELADRIAGNKLNYQPDKDKEKF
jgi:ribosome biogenesis protein Tsr3